MPPDFIRPGFLPRPSFGTARTLADGLGLREARYRLRLRPAQLVFGNSLALNFHSPKIECRLIAIADILRGGPSFGRGGHDFHLLVENNTRERVELATPGRTIENRSGMGISGVPSLSDAGRTEVDVLGVVLAIELRRQKPHHMHPRRTTVTGQLLHRIAVTLRRR